MATKSRLGKGLGALFPSLPGESAKSEATTEPVSYTHLTLPTT